MSKFLDKILDLKSLSISVPFLTQHALNEDFDKQHKESMLREPQALQAWRNQDWEWFWIREISRGKISIMKLVNNWHFDIMEPVRIDAADWLTFMSGQRLKLERELLLEVDPAAPPDENIAYKEVAIFPVVGQNLSSWRRIKNGVETIEWTVSDVSESVVVLCKTKVTEKIEAGPRAGTHVIFEADDNSTSQLRSFSAFSREWREFKNQIEGISVTRNEPKPPVNSGLKKKHRARKKPV